MSSSMSVCATRRTTLRRVVGCAGLISLGAMAEHRNPTEFWQQPRVIHLQVPHLSGKPLEFEYWRDKQLQVEAYMTLSHMCQDRHSGQSVQMDPRVFDLMFATQKWYQHVTGRTGVHQITSAYRNNASNAKVGGAPNSLHLTGKALDGRLLGLDLATYAGMLQTLKAGGVGLYAHHVHWDVGRSANFWIGGAREPT